MRRCRPWSGAPAAAQQAPARRTRCAVHGAARAVRAPPPEPTTAQRLQELETLRATGAISDDEYNAKRQQILTDL